MTLIRRSKLIILEVLLIQIEGIHILKLEKMN